MKYIICIFLLIQPISNYARDIKAYADSLRNVYQIPELGFAVVSGDSLIAIHMAGSHKVKGPLNADINDRFRIGSNTKEITSFIAAQLVKQGKLKWDTKLFDVCPELKAISNKEYYNTTLLQLLSFRSKLLKYTYTDSLPTRQMIYGNEEEQRYHFIEWALKQPVPKKTTQLSFSNPGYAVAGLMLERASGKTYKELVSDLGRNLDIQFAFGAPNATDTLQPWGHNEYLTPEAPADNYKLNWLQSAGNINVSLPGYAKFVQLQLCGLRGRSKLLTKKDFEFLHFGFPEFAVGWFWEEENGHKISTHTGNPGTFLTRVVVNKDADRAYILFANAQTSGADAAFTELLKALKHSYGK